MRSLLLASTILCLTAAPVSAQERSPDAALADAARWTGFYVGGQFGFAVANSTFDVDTGAGDFFDEAIDDPAIIGGLYVGYMQQLGHVILGVEGDFSGMPLDHGNDDVFFNGKTSFDYSSHWLSTVRGSAGITYADMALYATGGLAIGQVEVSYSDTIPAAPLFLSDSKSQSDVKLGWTIGAGAALALDQHWQAKAEYLFVDLDDTDFSLTAFSRTVSVDNQFHIGRIGLAYKF